MTEIDLPDVPAEVEAAFERSEHALVTNDVAVLNELFWADARTVRYGPKGSLYGRDEILAFRKARPPQGLERTQHRTVITTFGRALATAKTGSPARASQGSTGRARHGPAWPKAGGWSRRMCHSGRTETRAENRPSPTSRPGAGAAGVTAPPAGTPHSMK